MRVAALSLLLSFLWSATPVHAFSEWTWHKTSDGLHPNSHEQQQLWLINRARNNPTVEGVWLSTSSERDVAYGRDYFKVDRNRLRSVFAAIPPKPPAAHDVRLYRAAKAHSHDQIARDVQDHKGQLDRVDAEGFLWTQFRGNVFSYSQSALNSHAGFNIDWGYPGSPFGMQDPPGHRMAIMSTDGNYTNVGIATINESNPHTKVGREIVTQNFAKAATTVSGYYNEFIVGTVWKDRNSNGRYDQGEGYGGVTVTPSGGDYFAVTAAGGGYAIPITETGHALVTFSGGGLPEHSTSVRLGSQSVLVDYNVSNAHSPAVSVMAPGPALTIAAGDAPSGSFGYLYGTGKHQSVLRVNFANPGVDSIIWLQGFDIDRRREVVVYLNGDKVSTLSAGGDNQFSVEDRIFLESDRLRANNVLELRQKTLGERWGVRHIRLETNPATTDSLSEGLVDTEAYGARSLNGSNPAAYRTSFVGAGKDLLLNVHGYQIEGDQEVEVVLNGDHLGWMRSLRNNKTMRQTRFSIPFRLQKWGNNELEFRAYDDEWGIQNLEMVDVTGPSVPLSVGATNLLEYGWRAGSSQHQTLVRTTFTNSGQDLQLSVTGTGDPSEADVAVFLNNVKVGSVKVDDQNPQVTRRILPKTLMVSGTNVLEFGRKHNPNASWAVRNIELLPISAPDVQLTPNVVNPGSYGFGFGASQHRGLVRTRFVNTGGDLVLNVAGYNVTSRSPVTVWLNGSKLGRLAKSGRKELGAIEAFALPAHLLTGGINEVVFRQNKPGRSWGVAALKLTSTNSPVVSLNIGATDFNSYGFRYGSDQHASVLRTTFNSTGKSLDLSVVGFDIDSGSEVLVYLNGKRVGALKRTANLRHGDDIRIFLPAGAQVSGQNELEFIRPKPKGKWGVTKLKLSLL